MAESENATPKGGTRALRGAVVAFAAVAAAGLVVGIVALDKAHRNGRRIDNLEAQVQVLGRTIGKVTPVHLLEGRVQELGRALAAATTAAKHGAAVGEKKLAALQTTVTGHAAKQAKTEATLATVVSCLPEVQTEIKDLESKHPLTALSAKCSALLAPAATK